MGCLDQFFIGQVQQHVDDSVQFGILVQNLFEIVSIYLLLALAFLQALMAMAGDEGLYFETAELLQRVNEHIVVNDEGIQISTAHLFAVMEYLLFAFL